MIKFLMMLFATIVLAGCATNSADEEQGGGERVGDGGSN